MGFTTFSLYLIQISNSFCFISHFLLHGYIPYLLKKCQSSDIGSSSNVHGFAFLHDDVVMEKNEERLD